MKKLLIIVLLVLYVTAAQASKLENCGREPKLSSSIINKYRTVKYRTSIAAYQNCLNRNVQREQIEILKEISKSLSKMTRR